MIHAPTESPPSQENAHGLQQAALIVNTRSRRGQVWFDAAVQALQKRFDLIAAHAVQNPAHAPELAEQAVQAGTPLVLIGGGDGTLSACVKSFIGRDSVLGTLPLGTGNQFTRDLGIPTNIEAACRIMAEGKIASVDVGQIDDDYFLTVATIGLTTHIAEELTVEAKRKWGRMVYAVVLWRALRKCAPFDITLKVGDEFKTFRTLQAIIGNGRYHGGPFPLSPDATITDGKFVIYALDGVNKWSLARYALNLPGGNHVYLNEIPVYYASEGTITTKPPQLVTVDGEVERRTPIHFRVLPRALRVIAPQEFAG